MVTSAAVRSFQHLLVPVQLSGHSACHPAFAHALLHDSDGIVSVLRADIMLHLRVQAIQAQLHSVTLCNGTIFSFGQTAAVNAVAPTPLPDGHALRRALAGSRSLRTTSCTGVPAAPAGVMTATVSAAVPAADAARVRALLLNATAASTTAQAGLSAVRTTDDPCTVGLPASAAAAAVHNATSFGVVFLRRLNESLAASNASALLDAVSIGVAVDAVAIVGGEPVGTTAITEYVLIIGVVMIGAVGLAIIMFVGSRLRPCCQECIARKTAPPPPPQQQPPAPALAKPPADADAAPADNPDSASTPVQTPKRDRGEDAALHMAEDVIASFHVKAEAAAAAVLATTPSIGASPQASGRHLAYARHSSSRRILVSASPSQPPRMLVASSPASAANASSRQLPLSPLHIAPYPPALPASDGSMRHLPPGL